MHLVRILPLLCLTGLVACGPTGGREGIATDQGAFSAISPDETISLVGTEPFWGGTITDETVIYTTPENPEGARIPVRRFAGNNGLGFSGRVDGSPFDIAITPGNCSDGMSDRTFPFTATLMIGGEQRRGCAWTSANPFEGPEQP